MLDDFRRIAETATPQLVQSRMVTPDEARAVITSFNRLTESALRENFLSLPVDNIIEFSMIQTKKRPSLHNYMNEALEPQEIPEIVEVPDEPEIIAEEKPKSRKKAKVEESRSDEKFFLHLTERLEQIVNQPSPPQSIVVETTERHIEKLFEIESSMLSTMHALTERVEHLTSDSTDTHAHLLKMFDAHKTIIVAISESQTQLGNAQAQISDNQTKLFESQVQIADAIGLLAEKIAVLSQTPPVVNIPAANIPAPIVNIPAPIVNVSMQEGRRTKIVERDHNNLISKVIEGYEESDA